MVIKNFKTLEESNNISQLANFWVLFESTERQANAWVLILNNYLKKLYFNEDNIVPSGWDVCTYASGFATQSKKAAKEFFGLDSSTFLSRLTDISETNELWVDVTWDGTS